MAGARSLRFGKEGPRYAVEAVTELELVVLSLRSRQPLPPREGPDRALHRVLGRLSGGAPSLPALRPGRRTAWRPVTGRPREGPRGVAPRGGPASRQPGCPARSGDPARCRSGWGTRARVRDLQRYSPVADHRCPPELERHPGGRGAYSRARGVERAVGGTTTGPGLPSRRADVPTRGAGGAVPRAGRRATLPPVPGGAGRRLGLGLVVPPTLGPAVPVRPVAQRSPDAAVPEGLLPGRAAAFPLALVLL